MKSKGIVTTDQSTHKGNLKAEFIIHIAFQKSIDRWQSKFRQCLNKADKKKMKSLSFPVLGTGRLVIYIYIDLMTELKHCI